MVKLVYQIERDGFIKYVIHQGGIKTKQIFKILLFSKHISNLILLV